MWISRDSSCFVCISGRDIPEDLVHPNRWLPELILHLLWDWPVKNGVLGPGAVKKTSPNDILCISDTVLASYSFASSLPSLPPKYRIFGDLLIKYQVRVEVRREIPFEMALAWETWVSQRCAVCSSDASSHSHFRIPDIEGRCYLIERFLVSSGQLRSDN